MVLETIAIALWAMLPAYIPNNAAVIFGGGRPIDGGRTLGGSRLLGDGKTWRGAVAGIAAGAVLAVFLNRIVDPVSNAITVSLPEFSIFAILLLPAGAILGDIGASFLKRRTGRERGAPFPGVDQLDFVVGALLLVAIPAVLGIHDWFFDVFGLGELLAVFIITPVLHVVTNAIAYWLEFKDEPW